MRQKIISESVKQTQKIAAKLARKVVSHSAPNIIGLSGELGSGKTTFVQGFAKALGIRQRIISPTFVLMKKYKTNLKTLVHIDAYRIKKPKEIIDLGWKELMKTSENIVLIEWVENIEKILPKRHIWINFSHLIPKGHHKRRGIDIKFVKYYNFLQ